MPMCFSELGSEMVPVSSRFVGSFSMCMFGLPRANECCLGDTVADGAKIGEWDE